MRIGIDCSALYDENGQIKGGIGYYIYHLLTEILQSNRDHIYVLVFNDVRWASEFDKYDNVEVLEWPWYAYRKYLPLVYTHLIKGLFLEKLNLDLMHWTANTKSLVYREPSVITVHDLAILNNPEWFDHSALYTKFFLPQSLKQADHIIAVSEATKDDLIKFLQIESSKITVVYEGTNDLPEATLNIKRDNPYLFFVGTIEPRKNIINMIKAFELVMTDADVKTAWPNLELVLAGRKGWLSDDIYVAAAQSLLRDKIEFLGMVSDTAKTSLLKNAAMLLYPSWYEGFGLPVLEGFIAGVPVITSNISSLPEVAGEAAFLVNPAKIEELAIAIKTVLLDKNKKDQLIKLGQEQYKKFTWSKAAQETIAVYADVIFADCREKLTERNSKAGIS